jgi:hypothetical protein
MWCGKTSEELTVPEPIAKWNSLRDVWERTETPIFGPLDVYSETFPTSGMTVNGVAYELPTWEPHTGGSGSLSSPLFGTPRCAEAMTSRDIRDPLAIKEGNARARLEDQVAMLPTPRATLLPSPRASEGEKGGPNMRGSKGDLMLSSAVTLFQTPSVADGTGGHERRGGKRGNELLLNGQVKALVGANTNPQSDAGRLFSDVPLPIPLNPQDAMEDTA